MVQIRFTRETWNSLVDAAQATFGATHKPPTLNHAHQMIQRRERQIQRFEPVRHAQRVLPTHSRIHDHFQLRRQCLTAEQHRVARYAAFHAWREVAGFASAVVASAA